MLAVMLCAVISGGCGGGSSDSSAPEQTESLNEDTGSYDPNEGGKGTSGTGETDLSSIWSDYIAHDGEILKGKLEIPVKISVADGATITLRDVTIEGKNWGFNTFAGINCLGDATINLEGTNYVKGHHWEYPGIHVPRYKTLTFKGSGSLDASSNGRAAGIGGGWYLPCGNIVIDGGTIKATGGEASAGIGGGYRSDCGTITITGGQVKATKGSDAEHSIGAGYESSCEKVTIYGWEGAVSDESFTYPKNIVDLSTITADYIAQDGEALTGKLGAYVKVSIADGATVVLWNVTINGVNSRFRWWAGINCKGDAVIRLAGTNSVKGFYRDYPGIHIPKDKTLTINGDGELTASSNGYGAGIGGGWRLPCGNIVIDGGTITAKGGEHAAGIGGGYQGAGGTITINGGKITATKGKYCPYSVGLGDGGTGDKEITICGAKYTADEDTFTYGFEPNTDGAFNVKIDVGGAYITKRMAFYGRKYLGLNEDGSYKLSDWEKLGEWSIGEGLFDFLTNREDQDFNVSRKYVELGFEFNISLGLIWAYSNKFWPADLHNRIDKVEIAFWGTSLIAEIEIKVNGYTKVNNVLSEHLSQYDW